MGSASGLFEPSPLLDWLPDETLFSLVSRLHFFWGTDTPWKTSRILFDSSRAGCLHDFPDRLAHFVLKTHGQLGECDSLAGERTLLRFYRTFMSEQEYRSALEDLSLARGSALKHKPGILAHCVRSQHPLKACPVCMEQDLQRTGWAYWHGQHQYPGVWVCPIHRQFLHVAPTPSPVSPGYALPHQLALGIDPCCGSAARPSKLHALAALIVALVEHGQRIERARLSELYQQRLITLGLVKAAEDVDFPSLAADYMDHVRQFRGLPELCWLPEAIQTSGLQLERLLLETQTTAHPLRHMLVISWLWGTEECFWRDYARGPVNLQPAAHGLQHARRHAGARCPVPSRDEFLALLSMVQSSITYLAEILEVDPLTVRRWAANLNIQLPHHSLKLADEQLIALITRLREGAEKGEVAKQYDLSLSTVEMILKGEVGLREEWQRARFEKQRQQSRETWLAAGVGMGLESAQSACTAFPNDFLWLYKHDYEWLQAMLMRMAPPSGAGDMADEENQGDIALYAKILMASLRLRLSADKSVEHLWWYYRLVPGLKASMKYLHRFPRSKQLLTQLICQWHLPPKTK